MPYPVAAARGHAASSSGFPELIANPSVEVEGDTGYPASWFRSSNTSWGSVARRGVRSLRIQVTDQTADWRAQYFAVTAGVTYRLLGYFKGTGSAQTFLTIRWFSNPNGTGFISEDNINLEGVFADWTLKQQDIVAPIGAQSADVMFRCPAATAADIYGDDFSVRQIN